METNSSLKQDTVDLPSKFKPFLPALLIIAVLILTGTAIYRWQNMASLSQLNINPAETQATSTRFFNGVITVINPDYLTVKTVDQIQTIDLSLPSEIKIMPGKPDLPKTATSSTIRREPVKASVSDLKVGDSILVLIQESNGQIIKQEIQAMR